MTGVVHRCGMVPLVLFTAHETAWCKGGSLEASLGCEALLGSSVSSR